MRISWIVILIAVLACCSRERPETARAQAAFQRYGCPACHVIPGVPGAQGLVGPSLENVVERVYIAGVLTNTQENLVNWVKNPKAVDSKTAMPMLNVTDQDARDIANYLYFGR